MADPGKPVTLQGEIVDLECFLARGEEGHGYAHAACAVECIGKGAPAGFLCEGKVYILFSGRHEPVGPAIAGIVTGAPITISALLFEHDGMRALQFTDGTGGEESGEAEAGEDR